jgi:hypothetical protein
MGWQEQIFRYCERGEDAAFWAEPVNALTNAAFLIAASLAVWQLMRAPRRGLAEALLIALVFVMGVGSFLFHTYATRWASYADTVPIGIFMLAYLAYALRRFLELGWAWVVVCLAIFGWTLQFAGKVQCGPGLLTVMEPARGACLNGTAGYVPAWIAMVAIAGLLAAWRHPAWRHLAIAAAVFLASMMFRTVDLEICHVARLSGRAIGTHFLWHILNATMLYILLLAAIRHGGDGSKR